MIQFEGVAAVRPSRARLALSVFVVVMAAAALLAQQKADPAAVTGTVSDQKGVGVGGATVSMQGGLEPVHSVTTDDQGLYAITDLGSGSYTLTVTFQGIKIFQGAVTLSPGQVLTLSVAGAPL